LSADQTPIEEAKDPTAESEDAAVAVMEDDPLDKNSPEEPPTEELRVDEPVDEPTADVVSADPAGALASDGDLRAALEALLFTAPEPISAVKLSHALGNIETKRIKAALRELGGEYEAQRRGLKIVEIAGGFQMATQERFSEYVLALGTKKKSQTLSGPMLETLSIIAYRQPVIRAVVEAIRGVESSGVIRNLLDLGLVEVTGRKEVIGRPQLYGTSEKFLKTFGLKNLKQLPTVRGLKEKLRSERDAADEKASLTHHVADGGEGVEEETEAKAEAEETTEEVVESGADSQAQAEATEETTEEIVDNSSESENEESDVESEIEDEIEDDSEFESEEDSESEDEEENEDEDEDDDEG